MLTSKLAEISALSTVEKPIFTPEQMSGFEVMWSEDNIVNNPYLLVNPIENVDGSIMPTGPVGYTKPPAIPPALAALMGLVDVDIQELLGNSGEADKMLSHVSGKAHEMIQKRIDGQAFIYMSNFSKAIRRAGEVWLSIIKVSPFDEEQSEHHFFRYADIQPGYGYAITTYRGNGDPLPSFAGSPYLLTLEGDAAQIAAHFWKSLDEENKISLAVRRIDPQTGEDEIEILNRYSPVGS